MHVAVWRLRQGKAALWCLGVDEVRQSCAEFSFNRMGREFVARNGRDSFECPAHLNTSFVPTTNLLEVVAKGLTAGPESVVKTFPQGKRKGGHGRGGFLKEDFSQS
jgi:hypothetical protein